jgi:hypothetical protein
VNKPICVFSKLKCKECPIFRGRHVFIHKRGKATRASREILPFNELEEEKLVLSRK